MTSDQMRRDLAESRTKLEDAVATFRAVLLDQDVMRQGYLEQDLRVLLTDGLVDVQHMAWALPR